MYISRLLSGYVDSKCQFQGFFPAHSANKYSASRIHLERDSSDVERRGEISHSELVTVEAFTGDT